MIKFALSCLLLAGVYSVPPPSYIKPCSTKDKDAFNKCAYTNALEAIPIFVKGDKQYGIPMLVPFKLQQIVLNPSDKLKIVFDDMTVSGLDNVDLKSIDYDPKVMHMKISIDIPVLTLIGKYEIKGQLLVLPIEGSGPSNVTVLGGKYSYDFDLKLEEREGEKYAKIVSDQLEYKLTKAEVKLDNLFNGDPTLGPEMNKFINENWEEVFKDLGGAIKETVTAICRTVLENYFKRIPFNQLFLD